MRYCYLARLNPRKKYWEYASTVDEPDLDEIFNAFDRAMSECDEALEELAQITNSIEKD